MMDLDEIINKLQSMVNHGSLVFNVDPIREAIPYLRRAKDQDAWTEWPTCPRCGGAMRRESISYILFTCPDCDEVRLFDIRFKVKEADDDPR
jgi:hypothetical protein